MLRRQIQKRWQRRALFHNAGRDELRNRQQLHLRLLRGKGSKGEDAIRRAEINAKDESSGHAGVSG
jgi:hypothetical protein